MYDNQKIKRRIKTELMPLLEDRDFGTVVVASHLLKFVGHDVDAAFLRSVTSRDAYTEIAKFRKVTGDVFRLDGNSIEVRSAMYSEYLIQNHLASADIIDGAYPIIVEVVKRKGERPYQAIVSSLMRFSVLGRAMRNDPHCWVL